MKTKIFVFLLVVITVSLTSCGDLLETSNNGKLDGFWQLAAVDTLATGGHRDMADDRKFMSVQGKILEMHDADEGIRYMFRFAHADGKLSLSDARIDDRNTGDPAVESVDPLRPFGLDALDQVFTVEKLSGGRLVLVTGSLRLSYRKF